MLRVATLCALLAGAFCGCDRKPATPTPPPTPPPIVVATPPPLPTPAPTPYVPMKNLQIGSMFNGFQYRANLETVLGENATTERGKQESYVVEVNVKVKVPKP